MNWRLYHSILWLKTKSWKKMKDWKTNRMRQKIEWKINEKQNERKTMTTKTWRYFDVLTLAVSECLSPLQNSIVYDFEPLFSSKKKRQNQQNSDEFFLIRFNVPRLRFIFGSCSFFRPMTSSACDQNHFKWWKQWQNQKKLF